MSRHSKEIIVFCITLIAEATLYVSVDRAFTAVIPLFSSLFAGKPLTASQTTIAYSTLAVSVIIALTSLFIIRKMRAREMIDYFRKEIKGAFAPFENKWKTIREKMKEGFLVEPYNTDLRMFGALLMQRIHDFNQPFAEWWFKEIEKAENDPKRRMDANKMLSATANLGSIGYVIKDLGKRIADAFPNPKFDENSHSFWDPRDKTQHFFYKAKRVEDKTVAEFLAEGDRLLTVYQQAIKDLEAI